MWAALILVALAAGAAAGETSCACSTGFPPLPAGGFKSISGYAGCIVNYVQFEDPTGAVVFTSGTLSGGEPFSATCPGNDTITAFSYLCNSGTGPNGVFPTPTFSSLSTVGGIACSNGSAPIYTGSLNDNVCELANDYTQLGFLDCGADGSAAQSCFSEGGSCVQGAASHMPCAGTQTCNVVAPAGPIVYCPSCPMFNFTATGAVQTVNVTSPYVNVFMWGAGGASTGASYSGGYGAFVSGVLAVEPGTQLQLLVGETTPLGTPSANPGLGCGAPGGACGGGGGGGRSALLVNKNGNWTEMVTVGGGGGGGDHYPDAVNSTGGHAGKGLFGYNSITNNSAPAGCEISTGYNGCGGISNNYSTSCSVGDAFCSPIYGCCGGGGGGGGWCSGISGCDNGGGGGSSNPSNLLCAYATDYPSGGFSGLPFSNIAGLPDNSGFVVIMPLPSDWQPCSVV